MAGKGNVAVITGASSGMGREFALQIVEGYPSVKEVWLIARRQERLEQLQKYMPGLRVRIFALDITKTDDLDLLQSVLEQSQPRIRILVNAAGFGMMGRTMELTEQENLDMIDLNCKALTAVTCRMLPYMAAGSNILQLASSAAFLPQPGFAVYAATKAYVENFSRALHQELLEQHITVTAVCPGPVRTEFFDRAQKYQEVKGYKKLTMARADQVVRRALLDAKHGHTLSVYGGSMKAFSLLCKVVPWNWILHFLK